MIIPPEMLWSYEIPCSSKHGQTFKHARSFARKLLLKHSGLITITTDSIYHNNETHIELVCLTCDHRWFTQPVSVVCNGSGCPMCARRRVSESAGTISKPHASEALKEFACRCNSAGLTVTKISKLLRKPRGTVSRWVNPDQKRKCYESNKKWKQANPERYKEAQKNYRHHDLHRPKVNRTASERRAYKREALFYVWIDGVETKVNMYDHTKGNKQGKEIFSCPGGSEKYAELRKVCEFYEELTGEKWEVDHLVPLAAGGTNDPENLCCRLASVNRAKACSRNNHDDQIFAKRIFNIR